MKGPTTEPAQDTCLSVRPVHAPDPDAPASCMKAVGTRYGCPLLVAASKSAKSHSCEVCSRQSTKASRVCLPAAVCNSWALSHVTTCESQEGMPRVHTMLTERTRLSTLGCVVVNGRPLLRDNTPARIHLITQELGRPCLSQCKFLTSITEAAA